MDLEAVSAALGCSGETATHIMGQGRVRTYPVKAHLVRRGDTWKIKTNQSRLQVPPNSPQHLPPGFPTPPTQTTTWPPV